MVHALMLATALSLNGSWEFRFEEDMAVHDASAPTFEATDTISVPGCYDALPKWFMKRGTGLYRKEFTLERPVPAAWLVIDGLGLYGKFWIDGRSPWRTKSRCRYARH